MSLISFLLLIGIAMGWMTLVFFYERQSGNGCWCGPFSNWVPADGLLHAVDSLHFEHVLTFACSNEHTCVGMEGKPARKEIGQHYTMFVLWCIVAGTLPLMIVGGITLKKLFMLLKKRRSYNLKNESSPFVDLVPLL